jgi:hypothetical protein
VLSTSRPRNLMWETSLISLLLQTSRVSVNTEFFVINCIQWVFNKLIVNKFYLNQLYANCKFSLSLVSTKDKIDDVKDSFYEELESVIDKFPII